MTTRKPTVLLTGFGPFPGIPANATSVLVPRLRTAAARRFRTHDIVAEVLPTEWAAGPRRAAQLLLEACPEVVLHFGVATRAKGFEIEARGRNITDGRMDACGDYPATRYIQHGGPEYRASSVPVRKIVDRLMARGLPARVSRSAGGYLCNCVLYHSLAIVERFGQGSRNGFVHLPASLVDENNPRSGALPESPMSQEEAIEGGLEIIAVCLDRPARSTVVNAR